MEGGKDISLLGCGLVIQWLFEWQIGHPEAWQCQSGFHQVFHWQRGNTWEPAETPPVRCFGYKNFLLVFVLRVTAHLQNMEVTGELWNSQGSL